MTDRRLKRYIADIGIALVASSAVWLQKTEIGGTVCLFVGMGCIFYGNLIGGEDRD